MCTVGGGGGAVFRAVANDCLYTCFMGTNYPREPYSDGRACREKE